MIPLLLAALATASAQQADDPTVLRDAIHEEIARSRDLSLPDADPPHHVLVQGAFGWEIQASASMGALVRSSQDALDDLSMEVRAGTPDFDSTGLRFERDEPGFTVTGIADVPTARSVRELLWHHLDTAYKSAVENLGRKQAFRQSLEESGPLPPSWEVLQTPTVVEEVEEPIAAPALPAVEDYVRTVSAGPRGLPLLAADARVWLAAGHRVVVGTDGTSVLATGSAASLSVTLQARADDGETRRVSRTWTAETFDELPATDRLVGEVVAMADDLLTWATATPLDGPWVGPILLEGEAAARVVDDVIVEAVQGTPEPVALYPWSRRVRRPDPRYAAPGTRLLPRGWTVFDDGTRAAGDPCCARYDAEGTPLQAVTLLEDGVVTRHLMTRTPSEFFVHSTGHASSRRGERSTAKPTWLEVTAPRTVSRTALLRRAHKEARLAGVDAVLVIRDWDLGLGVLISPDGSEVPVRTFDSDELDARSLRGIRFAGPSSTVQPDGRTRYTVPSLLLDNVAIEPEEPGSRMSAPRRPSPLWDPS